MLRTGHSCTLSLPKSGQTGYQRDVLVPCRDQQLLTGMTQEPSDKLKKTHQKPSRKEEREEKIEKETPDMNTKNVNPRAQRLPGCEAEEGACFRATAGRWTPPALTGGELPAGPADRQSPWRRLSSSSPCGLHLPSTARASGMKWRRIVIFATLQAHLPVTGKSSFYFTRSYFKAFLRKEHDVSMVASPPFWYLHENLSHVCPANHGQSHGCLWTRRQDFC